MSSKSCIFLLGVLLIFAIAMECNGQVKEELLSRRARSPDGSVDLTYKDDRGGREASVQYNQKIYRSDDGRVNVDAYAQGTRNFDYNRNDYGGGIRGSIRF